MRSFTWPIQRVRLTDGAAAPSDHYASPVAGKWQPRIPVHEPDDIQPDTDDRVPDPDVFQPVLGASAKKANEVLHEGADTIYALLEDKRELEASLRHLEDRYLAVAQQLREITADRDQLEKANALLVARVRSLNARVVGLELTLAAIAAQQEAGQ